MRFSFPGRVVHYSSHISNGSVFKSDFFGLPRSFSFPSSSPPCGEVWRTQKLRFPSVENQGLSNIPSVESQGLSNISSVESQGLSNIPSVENQGLSNIPSVESQGLSNIHSIENQGLSNIHSVENQGLSKNRSYKYDGVQIIAVHASPTAMNCVHLTSA